jgi:hypothetical protein
VHAAGRVQDTSHSDLEGAVLVDGEITRIMVPKLRGFVGGDPCDPSSRTIPWGHLLRVASPRVDWIPGSANTSDIAQNKVWPVVIFGKSRRLDMASMFLPLSDIHGDPGGRRALSLPNEDNQEGIIIN